MCDTKNESIGQKIQRYFKINDLEVEVKATGNGFEIFDLQKSVKETEGGVCLVGELLFGPSLDVLEALLDDELFQINGLATGFNNLRGAGNYSVKGVEDEKNRNYESFRVY